MRPVIQFNDEFEIVAIDGVRVSYQLLRMWTMPTMPGQWFRVLTRRDGAIDIEVRFDGATQ